MSDFMVRLSQSTGVTLCFRSQGVCAPSVHLGVVAVWGGDVVVGSRPPRPASRPDDAAYDRARGAPAVFVAQPQCQAPAAPRADHLQHHLGGLSVELTVSSGLVS